MEVNANINRDEHVILGRHTFDRTVKAEAAARDHDHDLAIEAEARVASVLHDAGILPAILFERDHAGRDIHPPSEAVWVVDQDHQRRVVIMALCNESGRLLWIASVQLYESCWLR